MAVLGVVFGFARAPWLAARERRRWRTPGATTRRRRAASA